MKSLTLPRSTRKNILLLVSVLVGTSLFMQHTLKRRLTRSNETSLLSNHLNAKNVRRKLQIKARYIPVTKGTKMKFGPAYLIGASAGNTTDKMVWDVIHVYASFNMAFYTAPNITCCLMYRSRSKTDIIQQPISRIKYHWAKAKLRTVAFTCLNVRHLYEDVPSKVGLSLAKLKCDKTSVNYIKPFVPYKKAGVKIALGTQVAYGSLNAELIIEWMETYKYLGVDKVISYYYEDLNMAAFEVLKSYHNSGFVDLYKYQPAGEGTLPRSFSTVSGQLFNDLTVVVKESLERMSGYTYFGIIDFDEFLIPAKSRSLKEMLYHLNKTHENAAGFVFKTQFYYTSWGKSGHVNDLILGRYINRSSSPPKWDRPKQIYKPACILHEGVSTHRFTPVKGLNRIHVPESEEFVRHFRKCWGHNRTVCLKTIGRVTDTSVAEWSMRIKDKVQQVRRKVLGIDK